MNTVNPSVIPFQFDHLDIRVLLLDGQPWFIAKDVAVALGYRDTINAIKTHCKYAKSLNDIGVAIRHPYTDQALRLDPQTKLIPEPDVYRLILRSKLPSAARFEAWVMEEVLPTIRRTGGYSGIPDTPADRCHAPDIETHLTQAVDHLSGALHNLTEALQQAQGRKREHLSHLVHRLNPTNLQPSTASPPSSPPPSCYTPEPENALSESMQEKLAAWLHGRSRCTLYEVCLEVFGIPPEDLNRAGQTRLGCMLKALGWVSQRETVAPNQRVKVYRPVEG
ncbi:Bro-N domain-containing protein [Thiorhodospira sibirica]|uniref:BRO-N domain-containing protein n=1 Tax=Thiorhodospira sibirica TaxID=154347 RepID=UPI00022C4C24|nr:BRO family protein [Thiorhodospira sibirica]